MAGFEEAEGAQHHALAKKIRLVVDDETFDLGGLNEHQVTSVLSAAFGEPLDLGEMVRLTFVVGGGKLVRSRYAEDMPRWCANAFKSIDLTEDKSASKDLSSQGCWKFHHDTGKNLKTVVVFPRLNPEKVAQSSGGGGAGDGVNGAGAATAEGGAAAGPSERDLLIGCPVEVFADMMAAKAPSWSQKQKALKDVIQPLHEKLEGLEAKLIRGEQMAGNEEKEYEELSAAGLNEKAEWIQAEMKRQVDRGQLTAVDKERLIHQVEGRLTAIEEELAKLEAEEPKPAKKVEKLQEQRKVMEERKTKLEGVHAGTPPLKREAELVPLYRRLWVLQQERNAIKGRLLSLPELKKFSEIERIEENVAQLVSESRGFFETDEELADRAKVGKKKALANYKGEAKKSSAAAAGSAPARRPSGGGSGGWSTVSSQRVGSRGASGGGGGKAAAKNAFSALNDDSD